MPGTSGWTLLSTLKADPDLASIPVVMLTMLDDRNLGYLLGASEYLTKPIDRARLFAVLEKYRPCPKGCRVLIVEDEEGTRRTLRNALREQGWEVIEAKNGRAALDRVAETPPDLILLDLLMPEMDGFEFIEQLRRQEPGRDIPVVVITAKDLTPEEGARLEGDVQRILHKGEHDLRAILQDIRRHMPPRPSESAEASSNTT